MEPFNPPRLIETDRLWLRQFTEADAPQLYYALLGDPAATEWLPMKTLESVDDARKKIRQMQRCWQYGTCYTWALEDKQTGHLCALIEIQPNLPRLELGVVTSMRPEHQRRRAGLEALRKLIDWMIAQPNVYRIFASCAPNGKSAPVMRKLGFKLEGRLANWDARPNIGIAVDDTLIYALTRQPTATERSAVAADVAEEALLT